MSAGTNADDIENAVDDALAERDQIKDELEASMVGNTDLDRRQADCAVDALRRRRRARHPARGRGYGRRFRSRQEERSALRCPGGDTLRLRQRRRSTNLEPVSSHLKGRGRHTSIPTTARSSTGCGGTCTPPTT